MAKNFKTLREKMSPESQGRYRALANKYRAEMPLDELWQAKLNLKLGTWIHLVWEDSRGGGGTWQELSKPVPLGKIETVGMVVSTDKQKIVITHSIVDKYAHSPISIPWACVKSCNVIWFRRK